MIFKVYRKIEMASITIRGNHGFLSLLGRNIVASFRCKLGKLHSYLQNRLSMSGTFKLSLLPAVLRKLFRRKTNEMENNVNIHPQDEEIIDWRDEAIAIINDVKPHVSEVFISEKLESNNFHIFLNLRTLENRKCCVKVSGSGFQIAGEEYDTTDALTENPEDVFETPYALLTTISEGYVQSFASKLAERMNALA